MPQQTYTQVRTNRDGVISRRSFIRDVSIAAGTGVACLGWRDAMMLNAQELRRQGRSCILLFMRGGPSQFESFDPKPGRTTGGETQDIGTAVTGIRIARGWENVAAQMRDISLIRSMNSREGAHDRAVYQLHTGYVPLAAVRFPELGSIAASEIGRRDSDLPNFVSVSGGRFGRAIGAGYLGTAHNPLIVSDPNRMPNNSELAQGNNNARFNRRLEFMRELEAEFAQAGAATRARQQRALHDSAARLVQSPRLRAFDLSQENAAVRDRYGRNSFGQGCLLARRLVEAGVTFVEVTSNGWDTHQDNFTRTGQLVSQVDPGFGSLIRDLRERRMLDRTLVIWMGEFGRTPRINGRTGRDHWPRSFSVALAGGGVQGGRVVGSTDADGNRVSNRPVTVPDLFCTFCHSLGINPRKENITPVGRPISIVDGGAHVRELF